VCCSCCSVLQCVAVVGLCIFVVKKKQQNVLQCVALYCTLMQCNAECCSSLDSVFSWTKKKQQGVLLSVTV